MNAKVKLMAVMIVAASVVVLATRALPTSVGSQRRRPHLLRLIDPEYPCGPVAAGVVTHLLGRPMALDDVKRGIPTDPRGRCSMTQIVNFLNRSEFAASGVRITPDALDGMGSATIAVLFVDESHFIVARPLGAASLLVFDPPRPARIYEVAAMPYEWAGHAVLATRDPATLSHELQRLGIRGHQ